jgi:ATP-binding cassette subfamily A (ABC1) protein 3
MLLKVLYQHPQPGYTGKAPLPLSHPQLTQPPRHYLVVLFVAPVFILILLGVVYHLSIFVATERETSMAELMAAQKVSITPRILSTFISFFTIYFPGFLICSILLTQILFTRTSDILLLWLTLLAALSLICASHFLASFFAKAQLAGLYISTLGFALALVTLAANLKDTIPQTQVIALAAIFPPCTWATLISDVAMREYHLRAFSLASSASWYQQMDGYLYPVFFILQIIVYSAAAYGVEYGLWGVKRSYNTIGADSDVAVRCTGLSKTYYGKRSWYWPFMRTGEPVKAVSDLDLEVKKGSVTFLLGPNGGGKTTTLKSVAGMTEMDSGSKLELNEGGLVFVRRIMFVSSVLFQEMD